MRSLGWWMLVAGIGAFPGAVPAQEDAPATFLTLERQTASLDRLLPHLLLVTVRPEPDPLVDPAFLPRKHGMAVRVALAERVVVLTSAALVEGAGDIEVSTALQPERGVASSAAPTRGGLADVRCVPTREGGEPRSPCDHGPAAVPAPAGACDPDRVLHAVTPAGAGSFVLVSTVVAARGGVLPEDLALVQGRFPEGTPLFDAEGRVAAVVVRPAADSSARSLAAPLEPPAPATPESAAPAGKTEAKP